ncbi:MAG: thioesterase family protein [Gammaproteobacteria bacterium]|nr:thioesterase family protein [Gammaproteobacteria bacterium]
MTEKSRWGNVDRNAPLELHTETVKPEYIDYNEHMNLAFYVLVFDHGTDEFFDYVGLDREYRAREPRTTFALEAHTTYLRELRLGAPAKVTTQLLDFDEKRIHFFHRMYHESEGYLAATQEIISMHIDTDIRRGTPIPASIMENMHDLRERHRQLGKPEQAGHVIGIRRRSEVSEG